MEGRDAVIFKLSRLLVPVCELDEEGRQTIAGNAQVLRLAPESLIAASDDEAWLTYLVKGELAIRSSDGIIEVVPSNSGRARRPLFNIHPQELHAQARTDSILLRFDRSLFRSLLTEQQRPRNGAHVLTSRQLFARVYAAWCEDALPLPPFPPEIHLLYGAGAPRNLRELTSVFRRSPELAQELVQAANRIRGFHPPARHPGEAVLQLGLTGARILSLCLMAKKMHTIEGTLAKRVADKQLGHALLIGALSYLLARRHRAIDPYRALAAGLVHDAGALMVPAFLAKHPEMSPNDEACAIAMRRLRGVVGPLLLARFGFDAAMTEAAEQAEHWHRTPPHIGDADVLVVAHVIAALEDPAPPVPQQNRVPAFTRLCPDTSRQSAIDLLRQAFRLCASLRRRLG